MKKNAREEEGEEEVGKKEKRKKKNNKKNKNKNKKNYKLSMALVDHLQTISIELHRSTRSNPLQAGMF